MQFHVNPHEGWLEGDGGHAELKAATAGCLSILPVFDKLVVKGPFAEASVINMMAFILKSRIHIRYLLDRNFMTLDNINPWSVYKANSRSLVACESLNRPDMSWASDGSDKTLTLKLFSVVKANTTVCATVRRLTNGLVWASQRHLKMSSSTSLKWETFDNITTYRRQTLEVENAE